MAKSEKDLAGLIFAEAAKEVALEGIVNEDAQTLRVNEIIKDASKDAPETDVGKKVREQAQVLFSGVESPYMKGKFDYGNLRHETVDPAIIDTLKLLAEHTGVIAPTASTQEEQDKLNKVAMQAQDRFSFEILQLLNKHNVALTDFKFFFQELKGLFAVTEQLVNNQVSGHRAEIISRLLGIRDPEFNKFDQGFATFKDLTDTVLKTRKATGDRLDDYFHIAEENDTTPTA